MKSASIIIFKEGVEVGNKSFNVDPTPSSKSLGYLVGYITAVEDLGYKVLVE